MSDDKHDKAVDLTEKALDAADEGDEKAAQSLIKKAKALDASAVDEVVHDLEEAENTSVKPVAE